MNDLLTEIAGMMGSVLSVKKFLSLNFVGTLAELSTFDNWINSNIIGAGETAKRNGTGKMVFGNTGSSVSFYHQANFANNAEVTLSGGAQVNSAVGDWGPQLRVLDADNRVYISIEVDAQLVQVQDYDGGVLTTTTFNITTAAGQDYTLTAKVEGTGLTLTSSILDGAGPHVVNVSNNGSGNTGCFVRNDSYVKTITMQEI